MLSTITDDELDGLYANYEATSVESALLSWTECFSTWDHRVPRNRISQSLLEWIPFSASFSASEYDDEPTKLQARTLYGIMMVNMVRIPFFQLNYDYL